jgi:lipopolysaccharide cholinephosphotransferase
MPPATGFLREKQLASFKILKIVAEFCEKEKITYWLEFGALLGAVRHKGFIPWDDDIDIGMLRDDFERFVDLFNQKNKNEDIEAIWFYHGDEYNLLKVRHKKVDGVWVDIFVRDLGYIPLTFEEKLAHTEEIKKLVKSNFKKTKKMKNIDELRKFYNAERQKLTFIGEKSDTPKTIFYGIEYCFFNQPVAIFDYDLIFPLKKISYEGCEFPCINNPDFYLTYFYRDYMKLPEKITHHVDLQKATLQEMIEVKKFLQKK